MNILKAIGSILTTIGSIFLFIEKTTEKIAKATIVSVELQRTNQADPNFRKVHRPRHKPMSYDQIRLQQKYFK